MLVDKGIDLLLDLTGAEDKVKHSEQVIRGLKKLGLDPDHPPEGFDGVYACLCSGGIRF